MAKFHYVVQLASRSQTSSRPNSITLAGLRLAREQVCDQVRAVSTCRDSSNLSATGRNLVCDQVCDLDSVMEFSLKKVADQLANQLASQLASWIA